MSAKCVYKHKISMIETVMEPIAVGLGAKPSKKKQKQKLTPQQKDSKLLMSIHRAGLAIKESRGKQDG